MDHKYIQSLIFKMDNPILKHYSSAYYDPEKAHEYYMQNRQLKGRSNSGLSDEGKKVWEATKSNIDSEKKSKIMEAALDEKIEIQNARTKAENTKTSITNKLKALSEALNNKYQENSEKLSDEQKAQLEVINRKRANDQKKIREQKQQKLEEINKDDSLSTEEKQAQRNKINEDSNDNLQDIKEKYNKEIQNVRSDTSEQRKKNSETKKEEFVKNSTDAKNERAKVATELKDALQKARDTYTSKKEEINGSYENTYQDEYDKIKTEYQAVKKASKGKKGKTRK